MEQFNLDKWLKDTSRKVIDDDGFPVEIIKWDANEKCPVVYLNHNGIAYNVSVDGMYDADPNHGLFFADEEEKLTEFESAFGIAMMEVPEPEEKEEWYPFLKEKSAELLDLARKEILKSLPKWKKAEKDEQEGKVLFEKSSGDCPKELIGIIDKEFGIDGRDENNNPLNSYGDWQCGMILNGPAISGLVKLGVEWQKQKDQETIELAEDHAMLSGMMKEREEMMKDAVDATILDVDSQTIEFGLWPEKLLLDIKEGDKVKIIIIKEN